MIDLPAASRRDGALCDYLGLSLLTVQLSASPALVRPDPDTHEGCPRTSSVHDGMNFDLLCEALSLQANDHVSTGIIWHEYPDAAPCHVNADWIEALPRGKGRRPRYRTPNCLRSSSGGIPLTVTAPSRAIFTS